MERDPIGDAETQYNDWKSATAAATMSTTRAIVSAWSRAARRSPLTGACPSVAGMPIMCLSLGHPAS